ncbi:helix-turn-helix transcriptional regulator [Blautia liquoris]|uniref:Helix-turn-helix transcriptional regulator n=1 Tax=Blautia liquoris TaxID=2779518 RepID=A0A7M2RE27_9FIRM|nr:helix-turn-helix transcriptional regulator [Blautia liquoris]QOV18569.1 helix-turn-helix transcriptional regulator [Blautia liquoris]
MSKDQTKYDFKAMGQAIKQARISRGWTREQLAQEVDLAPRYIMSLENNGQHPSFQVFITLMTLFNISVDQFLFPDKESKKSTRRRQLDAELDELDEKDYIVMQATAKGLKKAKTEGIDSL